MATVLFIVIVVILLVLTWVVLPRWGIRRGTPFVIQIFRQHSAVGRSNAKPINELGLAPPKSGMVQMMFGPRDYRLDALRLLMKASVVQRTEDGKFYLSEEDLAASKWKEL